MAKFPQLQKPRLLYVT